MFDLDNTIYPARSNLFVRVAVRITEFVARHFDVPHDEAKVIQKDLFHRYGTTMRGLMVEQGPLLHHQSAHGRAITVEQVLLDHLRLVMRNIEMPRHEFGDPHRHPHEQVRPCRIDGVVEIKHPVIDAVGGKAGRRLGLW